MMYKKIESLISLLDFESIPQDRIQKLDRLIAFIQTKKDKGEKILLNFICTHNSRRSQFAQVWAQIASEYYKIKANCYSGGVEITACNERTVNTLSKIGFKVEKNGTENPMYTIEWSNNKKILKLHSKLYDDARNPKTNFAAIMTCNHVDQNCPYVSGCEERISLPYSDPKNYDDTLLESTFYTYRSTEIATEMFYVFSKIK
ncbi:MAG: protein-tyrosine-phosphatase [Lishizhenia sp.]